MRPASWRGWNLVFCAITAAFSVANIFDITGAGGAPPWYGAFGATMRVSAEPYHTQVNTVDPGGPSDRAGLRRGDLIDIRANTLVDRFRQFFGQPMAGRPIVLTIQRGVQHTKVSVTPSAATAAQWDVWGIPVGCLWLALFAALIAWRRPYVPGNLLLSTALVLFAAGTAVLGGIVGGNFAAPWAWAYIVISVFNIAFPIAVAFWAAYATIFARPLSRVRRLLQWLCYLMAAAAVAVTCAQILGIITLLFDPISLFAPALAYPLFAAIFAALVSSALALASSRGVERQRAAWSLIPLASFPIAISSTLFVAASAQSYSGSVAAYGTFSAACLITPVVLTYVALNRRLIDIGFILNRAVVFTLVSTIVIGAFVLAEWAASQWLVSASHATSAAIGMAVALGLGLSLRYIHKYVDNFVDRVFFRKRHEDVAALRRFAHEASYITDRTILLERTVRTVKAHTDAEEASIFIRDGSALSVWTSDGERATVGENDPGIIALQAWHKPIDLASFEDSGLHGQFAFPMVSRGELVGVLTCGTKRDNEIYAPDEADALFALAQGVGSALGMLSTNRDGSSELILRELVNLREDAKRDRGSLIQEVQRLAKQLGVLRE